MSYWYPTPVPLHSNLQLLDRVRVRLTTHASVTARTPQLTTSYHAFSRMHYRSALHHFPSRPLRSPQRFQETRTYTHRQIWCTRRWRSTDTHTRSRTRTCLTVARWRSGSGQKVVGGATVVQPPRLTLDRESKHDTT